ncbi:anti-sigma factor [Halobacillus salinarum]|uniref:Anti-sigma-W factor RsiW n=1 Tax=Halobacillus salinarum TaxID=2932257 RepID=A0ABY4EIY1_9BACI|nr:anti-sigma factor [Halobacillus salinarum]UOQ44440.1 anti-sigma factor [Halobacillus salinarum]
MRNECDKIIDYFNDQLTEEEKKEFERHLENCEECQAELEELTMLTDDLPFASEPVDPPKDMKDRVLEAVFAEEQLDSEESSDLEAPDKTIVDLDSHNEESREPGKAHPTPHPWIIRGLVAALTLSLLGNVVTLLNQDETTEQGQQQQDITDEVAERVQLKGTSVQANATAALIQQDNKNLLTLQAEGLDQLQGSEVYQVWLIKGEKPYRAGTFVANQDGEGAVAYSLEDLPEDVDWDSVAISREPDATSETPQGEVIMSSNL